MCFMMHWRAAVVRVGDCEVVQHVSRLDGIMNIVHLPSASASMVVKLIGCFSVVIPLYALTQ